MDRKAALALTPSFLVAAEELNFRRTAERLGVDQSALSRRIRKLEATLGFALFERTTREVSLTPAGRSFYEANAALLHRYAAAADGARRIAEGKAGLLRIGYMAFAAIRLMPRVVARFRSLNPEIDVTLRYMRTQGQKLALADDELDVGFMIGPFDHSDFHSMRVAVEPLHLVMRADHPLAAKAEIVPADLRGEAVVLGDMAEWEAFRWRLEEMFSAAGIRLEVGLEASTTLALLGLVAAGLGLTIYPAGIAHLLSQGLETRPFATGAFGIETILVWKRMNRTAGLRRFVAAARGGI